MGDTFGELGKLGVGVATLAIILVVAFIIMSQGKTQIADIEGITDTTNTTQTDASVAWNSTTTLQNATDDIPGWIPLVIVASIGAIIIGMVRKLY